jgi:hypothetical protein
MQPTTEPKKPTKEPTEPKEPTKPNVELKSEQKLDSAERSSETQRKPDYEAKPTTETTPEPTPNSTHENILKPIESDSNKPADVSPSEGVSFSSILATFSAEPPTPLLEPTLSVPRSRVPTSATVYDTLSEFSGFNLEVLISSPSLFHSLSHSFLFIS